MIERTVEQLKVNEFKIRGVFIYFDDRQLFCIQADVRMDGRMLLFNAMYVACYFPNLVSVCISGMALIVEYLLTWLKVHLSQTHHNMGCWVG